MRTLNRKFYTGVAGALVTLALLIGLVVMLSVDWNRRLAWSTRAAQILESIQNLLTTVNEMETSQRSYVVSGDEAFRKSFQEAAVAVASQLGRVRSLVEDSPTWPTQKENLDQLAPLLTTEVEYCERVVDIRATKGWEAVVQFARTGAGVRQIREIQARLSGIARIELAQLSQREVSSRAGERRLFAAVGVLAAFALAITVMSIVSAHRYLVARREAELSLEAAHHQLEARVEQRTAELAAANQRLVEDGVHRQKAEDALRDSEQRFRLAAESATDFIYEWDIATGRVDWYGKIDEQLGYAPGEFPRSVAGWEQIVSPEDRTRVWAAVERTNANGEPFAVEYPVKRKDGAMRHWSVTGQPIYDNQGKPVRWIGAATDITERKLAERRQSLMVQELDHRVKNNLAAVLALSEQSLAAAKSLEEFREAFTGRIGAMARTHAALAQTRWTGVQLGRLSRLMLDPYLTGSERGEIQGEEIMLPARAASPLSLALHELATNAVKYGALSGNDGKVKLSWKVNDAGLLQIEWRESGGPEVTPPVRRGFGRDLIEGLLRYELHGSVEMSFLPTGLVCKIELPIQPERAAAFVSEGVASS